MTESPATSRFTQLRPEKSRLKVEPAPPAFSESLSVETQARGGFVKVNNHAG